MGKASHSIGNGECGMVDWEGEQILSCIVNGGRWMVNGEWGMVYRKSCIVHGEGINGEWGMVYRASCIVGQWGMGNGVSHMGNGERVPFYRE